MPVTSHNLTVSLNKASFSTFYTQFPFRNPKQSVGFRQFPRVNCAKKAKRSGKLRYPSEKKKLRQQQQTKTDSQTRLEGVWRISRLAVSVEDDPGKDFWGVSGALLGEIAKILKFPVKDWIFSDFEFWVDIFVRWLNKGLFSDVHIVFDCYCLVLSWKHFDLTECMLL